MKRILLSLALAAISPGAASAQQAAATQTPAPPTALVVNPDCGDGRDACGQVRLPTHARAEQFWACGDAYGEFEFSPVRDDFRRGNSQDGRTERDRRKRKIDRGAE